MNGVALACPAKRVQEFGSGIAIAVAIAIEGFFRFFDPDPENALPE